MKTIVSVLLILLAGLFAGMTLARAASSNAAASGAQIAQTVCMECHAVTDDAAKQSPNPKAPRFKDVAAMPSTTALSLKVFLRSSHKDMPNLMLDAHEMDAITDYILSLKGK